MFNSELCLFNFRVESLSAVEECHGVTKAYGRPMSRVEILWTCDRMIRSIGVSVRFCRPEQFGRAYMYALE